MRHTHLSHPGAPVSDHTWRYAPWRPPWTPSPLSGKCQAALDGKRPARTSTGQPVGQSRTPQNQIPLLENQCMGNSTPTMAAVNDAKDTVQKAIDSAKVEAALVLTCSCCAVLVAAAVLPSYHVTCVSGGCLLQKLLPVLQEGESFVQGEGRGLHSLGTGPARYFVR